MNGYMASADPYMPLYGEDAVRLMFHTGGNFMLALELTDIKDFMNKLLRSEIFDHFLLQEGVITSAASYVIDGHINKGFYSTE